MATKKRGKKRAVKAVKTAALEAEVVMGGYGTGAAAIIAASDFLRSSVFSYQSALFPNPVTFGVGVKISKATPFEVKPPENPLYPWAVKLEIVIDGPQNKATEWFKSFQDRTRGIRI